MNSISYTLSVKKTAKSQGVSTDYLKQDILNFYSNSRHILNSVAGPASLLFAVPDLATEKKLVRLRLRPDLHINIQYNIPTFCKEKESKKILKIIDFVRPMKV
jgi:hypothetical protein